MAINETIKTNIRQLSGVMNTESVISELMANSEKVKDIETCVPQDTEVVSLEGLEPCAPTSITPEEAKAARDKIALDIKQKLRDLIGVDKLVKMGTSPLLTQAEIDEYQAAKDLCERNCMDGIRTVIESNRAEEVAAIQEYTNITSNYLRKYVPGLFLLEFYMYVLVYYSNNTQKNRRGSETALNTPINELNHQLTALRNSIDESEVLYSPIAKSIRELFLKKLDSYILAASTMRRSPGALRDASARLGVITIPNGVGVEAFGKIIADIQSQAYAIANIDDIVTTTAELTGVTEISTGPVAQQSQLTDITVAINTTVSSVIRQVFQLMKDKTERLTNLSQLIMDSTPAVIDTGLQQFGSVLDFSLQTVQGNYPADDVRMKGIYDVIAKEPTSQEIVSGRPIEIRRDNIDTYIRSGFMDLLDEYQKFASDAAMVATSVLVQGADLTSISGQFGNMSASILESVKNLIHAFEINDMDYKKQRLMDKLSQLSCCGKPLVQPDVDFFAPISNTSTDDANWNTFEEQGQPQITELDYWKCYAMILNQVALLPVHYSIGLIVPSPAGPVNIPLPVVWFPVAVVKNPATLTVIFVTINGMVFSPVIWQTRWKPIADAESVHVSLFRGANASIKTGTGTKILNAPIVGGIDTAPEAHKLLPFEKDDIPCIERCRISNTPFLLYLNQWCSTAKPHLGLPG